MIRGLDDYLTGSDEAPPLAVPAAATRATRARASSAPCRHPAPTRTARAAQRARMTAMSNPATPWTAGQIRAALAGLPDDAVVAVNVARADDPASVDEQVITGAGFGRINWGDGYGMEQDTVFALDCDYPDREIRQRPDRPQKGASND